MASTGDTRDQRKREEEDEVSSSEDDSEMEEEAAEGEDVDALFQTINELKERLKNNPNDYDVHIELINLLRTARIRTELRDAREKMANIFPLTSQLWMEWIEDEVASAEDAGDLQRIELLFRRATNDYVSIDVLKAYADFIVENHCTFLSEEEEEDEEHEDTQKVEQHRAQCLDHAKDVFEFCLQKGGLHVLNGGALWSAYSQFALSVFIFCKNQGQDEENDGTESGLLYSKTGIYYDLLLAIHRRWAAVPLQSNGALSQMTKVASALSSLEGLTAEQLQQLETTLERIESVSQEAERAFEERAPFEGRVEEAAIAGQQSTGEKVPEWLEYAEFEKQKGEIARTCAVFERAIAYCCLSADIWATYDRFAAETLKDDSLRAAILHRAVRNVPWTSALWSSLLRLQERSAASTEEAFTLIESSGLRAIAGCSPVYSELTSAALSLCECLLRVTKTSTGQDTDAFLTRLKSVFENCFQALTGSGGDPSLTRCAFERFYAEVSFRYFKDERKGRELYDIVVRKDGRSHDSWIGFANALCSISNFTAARKLYRRALQFAGFEGDTIERLCDAYLLFERLHGSSNDADAAADFIHQRLQAAAVKRQADAKAVHKAPVSSEPKGKKRAASTDERKTKKRRLEAKQADQGEGAEGGRGQSSSTVEKKDRQGVAEEAVEEQERIEAAEKRKEEAEKDERTVFVYNLSFSTSTETLEEAFKSYGEIRGIRVVKDQRGRSKGLAYIEYSSHDAATSALAMDGKELEGRKLKVTISRPPVKGKKEEKTLFISKLPKDCKEEELREALGNPALLRQVRLVKSAVGKKKGIAYVEFETEEAAREILKLVDDGRSFEVRDAAISITPSCPPDEKKGAARINPPAQKAPEKAASAEKKTTPSFFVPAQLKRKVGKKETPRTKVAAVSASSAAKPAPSSAEKEPAVNEANKGPSASKSQEDFRRMMYGQ